MLAWKVILGSQGVVNSFLYWTGFRDPDDPVSQLLYSRFAVILVLVYVWVPFVALPIFVSLESLDRRLLEAASDLGASRWQAFWRVTLPPQPCPGVVAAFLFVFIPTRGRVRHAFAGRRRHPATCTAARSTTSSTGASTGRPGSVLALFLLGVVTLLTLVFAASSSPTGWRRADGRRPLEEREAGARACSLRLVVAFLYAPIVDPADLLVQRLRAADVPPQRIHARWYRQFLANPELHALAEDERDRRGALERGRRRAWACSPRSR